jgi:hypothetical protein
MEGSATGTRRVSEYQLQNTSILIRMSNASLPASIIRDENKGLEFSRRTTSRLGLVSEGLVALGLVKKLVASFLVVALCNHLRPMSPSARQQQAQLDIGHQPENQRLSTKDLIKKATHKQSPPNVVNHISYYQSGEPCLAHYLLDRLQVR